jgi:hypothetical protein
MGGENEDILNSTIEIRTRDLRKAGYDEDAIMTKPAKLEPWGGAPRFWSFGCADAGSEETLSERAVRKVLNQLGEYPKFRSKAWMAGLAII